MDRVLTLLFAALLCVCNDATARRTEHPGGFSFDVPDGWTVESFDGMARAFPEDAAEFVAVGPVLTQRGQSAADILRALVDSRRIGPLRAPALVRLDESGGDTAVALLTVMDKKAQAMVVLRGQAGTLYLFGAPAARFDERRAHLVAILQSFRLGSGAPAPAGDPPTPLRFERLTETRENAYSLEFPVGWQTQLGVYRVGAQSPRFESSAVSPDRDATVFLGERGYGSFVVPTAELAALGLREGMEYNPTGAHPMPLLRYLPGAEFARYWLGRRIPDARETGIRDRPDLARELARLRYSSGNPLRGRIHAGELSFEYDGQPGVVTAATESYGSAQGTQQWSLVYLAGYFATEARSADARAALAHALGSTRLNLGWLRSERAYAKLDHENVMATQNEINALFRSGMEARSESAARNARGVGDTLSGTYRVVDPTTGRTATVQAGSNFYYRVDGSELVVGSQTEQSAVDLTRMLRIDWDDR